MISLEHGSENMVPGSSHHGAREMNPTSKHEVVGLIRGLTQWVEHPALP